MAEKQTEKVELANLIDYVSEALRTADAKARAGRRNPVMEFLECEIECAIDVELKGDGAVRVWVLNLGAGAKRSETNTIKVKYRSLPQWSVVAQNTPPLDSRPGSNDRERSRTVEM